MASSHFLLLLSLALTLTPAALSATCKTHKFKTPNKSFATCADLPHLSAALHYTFNASSSTLSMAFTATPSSPAGWVAWAINPTAPGMAGSQTLLAYSNSSSLAVATFDVVSYDNVSRSPLSLDVSGLSAESSGGQITVFGTWRLPARTASVNQVWQVGPSVDQKGNPAKHYFKEENLKAMSTLQLTEAEADAPAPVPPKNAAGEGLGVGACMGLVLGGALIVSLL